MTRSKTKPQLCELSDQCSEALYNAACQEHPDMEWYEFYGSGNWEWDNGDGVAEPSKQEMITWFQKEHPEQATSVVEHMRHVLRHDIKHALQRMREECRARAAR
jgi:hypothetical protein